MAVTTFAATAYLNAPDAKFELATTCDQMGGEIAIAIVQNRIHLTEKAVTILQGLWQV